MANKTQRGMEVAAVASKLAETPHIRTKMGAALFAGSRLVSIGFNKYSKSHPDHKIHDRDESFLYNIHAEQAALIKRRHYENGGNLTMYVYRETTDGAPGCSKPCSMCQALLKEAGVRKVIYIDVEGNVSEMKF